MHIEKEELEHCDQIQIHQDRIDEAKKELPDEESLYDLADFFKVFADSTRIKILYVLLKEEMCVCDLAAMLNMEQSAISHQLRTLKQMELVKYRREGKSILYTLSDSHIEQILSQGMEHISE